MACCNKQIKPLVVRSRPAISYITYENRLANINKKIIVNDKEKYRA